MVKIDMGIPKNCYECRFAIIHGMITKPYGIEWQGTIDYSYRCFLTKRVLTSTKRERHCPLVDARSNAERGE